MIGIGIGVINSWLISLYFLSQVDGFLYMIFALIFTHVILVGFIGTIGMGVFGIGVSLIWAATVAAITWLQRLVFRVI